MLFASPYDVGNIEVSVLEAHVSFHYCVLVVKKVEPKWQHLYGEEIICKEDGFDLDIEGSGKEDEDDVELDLCDDCSRYLSDNIKKWLENKIDFKER